MTAELERDRVRVAALRTQDAVLLPELVAELTPAMLRLAAAHTTSRSSAEDVVQDAWLTVLSSVDRFEGRSALRTWVLGIVLNKARRVAAQERRTVPLSWWGQLRDRDAPAVDPDRFAAPGADQAAGTWVRPPHRWDLLPEDELGVVELRGVFETALDALPDRQRAVMTARDVLGLDAAEVAGLYGLSEGNQRVLLHRARSRVRTAVEQFLSGAADDASPDPTLRRRPLVAVEHAEPNGPPTGGLRPGSRRRPPRARPVNALVCQQLVELVDDYLDGALDPRLRARVEEHLDGCDGCSGYVAQVQRMLSVTATLVAPAQPTLVHRLVAALRAARPEP